MFPVGLEPATFRVWGGRDNHYTTETVIARWWTSTNLLANSVRCIYFSFVFNLAPCVNLKSKSFWWQSQIKFDEDSMSNFQK